MRLKALAVLRGRYPGLLSAWTNGGKRTDHCVDFLKQRAESRRYSVTHLFYCERFFFFSPPSLLHLSIIKVKYLWIRNRAGCCQRGMRGGGGSMRCAFFGKAGERRTPRRCTDVRKPATRYPPEK